MQKIINGDCLEIMQGMQGNNIDFIICDPPYGLKFMGKAWDHGIPGKEYWQEALRVCKPGSMLAAFGGTRTYHRLTCALEDAGWEIRDTICYLYGSGFPKSHNKFGIDGYGTALKPSWEPIILGMKPLDGTYAQNVENWGIWGINIDKCRVGNEDTRAKTYKLTSKNITGGGFGTSKMDYSRIDQLAGSKCGRWPANLILDEEAGKLLDDKTNHLKSGHRNRENYKSSTEKMSSTITNFGSMKPSINFKDYNDSGGASRFFYCAKASKSERNAGCEELEIKQCMGGGGLNNTPDDVCVKDGSIKAKAKNHHPTVKPLSLMRYIITLLAPPGSPTLLDPFAGSGSTLCAAKQLGINAIGIEIDPEYCKIAEARINHAKSPEGDLFDLI